VSPRDRVFRLARRARAGLEAMRLLQGAARGALAGGGVGLVALLAMKLRPAWPVAVALPWVLVGAGAVLGLLVALTRPGIPLAAAALFLDRRLGTHERFVTVVTRPAGPLTDYVAAELAAWRRLPRLPFPREAALVPLALFLVFAAGLLPEAGAGEAGRVVTVIVPGGGTGGTDEASAPVPEIDDATLRELEQGRLARPAELEEMLEHRLHRPEDRQAARDALDRARLGDRAATRDVAETVRALRHARRGGVTHVVAYPEEEKFLSEYRRARAEEDR
jgi:hypothetical protein